MIKIIKNKGLSIEQLEERFEMTVASSGSGSSDGDLELRPPTCDQC